MKHFNYLLNFLLLIIVFSSTIHIGQIKGGRWMFENNGNDDALWDGFNNIGNLSGSASFKNADSRMQGSYYLSIEDSASYGDFTVSDHEELDFINENFAASMWFYPVKGYDNPQHLLMKGDRSGAVKFNNYAIRINNEFIEFIVHSESGAKSLKRSSFKILENQWNFVAIYYDFVNSKLFFWNDEAASPIDTFDFDAPLFSNEDKLYVGTSGKNGYKRFWGRIDDLRISNKLSDIVDKTTSIESYDIVSNPTIFILNQNYPNPFNSNTLIRFSITNQGFTTLDIYNVAGQHIINLINNDIPAGEYRYSFNANNLSSGIYFYRLQQSRQSILKKMILIK